MLSKIRKPFTYTFRNVTLFIILINVAVFLLEGIYPPLKYYFSLNIINCLGKRMFWQPFTYMFIHGNFQHLLFNMLGLFFFGTSVEKAIGSKPIIPDRLEKVLSLPDRSIAMSNNYEDFKEWLENNL